MNCCKRKMSEDDEFECYARIVSSLMTTLRRPEDREYTQDILVHCRSLSESEKPEIRRFNNAFMDYFLKVLYTTASTQPLEIYESWYDTSNNLNTRKSTRVWLEDNKSYFAMEKTPDGAVIFYSAVAHDPKAGWDKGGIKKALDQYEENLLKEETHVDHAKSSNKNSNKTANKGSKKKR